MDEKLELGVLGKVVSTPLDEVEPVAWTNGPAVVELQCSEFTSHCPVTKQPDFASLTIRYSPDKHIAETKSVKMWLWSFRDKAAFNEVLVATIADQFMRNIQPNWVEVEGHFHPRGGISVHPTVRRVKEAA